MRNRKHDIERYLRGELSPAEMHALEKEALSDPFLAEALEGIEQAGADNFLYDLHKLNRSVHDRARKKNRKGGKVIRMWGWTTAVAATLLLIAVSGFLVINNLREQRARHQSMESSPVAPADTAQTASADSTTVKPGTNSPIASLDKADASELPNGESSRSTAPQAKKDQPPKESTSRAGEAERLALAELEDTRKELTPVDKPDEHADHDQAIATEEEARTEKSEAQPPVVKRPVDDVAVSRALEGRAAGVETKRRAEPGTQAAPAGQITAKGKVTDEAGQDLPGVSVYVPGTSNGTVTDAEGYFELAVPAGNPKLAFAFIGFESKEVAVNDGTEVNVTLEEDISALSEVVVTGYGAERAREGANEYRFAEPNGGRVDFKNYLANAVKYPQEAINSKTEGKVTIRFTVEPSGQLTDFEVVKGIGSGCEQELIRAIQQGPYWKPSTNGNQPVKDKVRVRYKSQLPK